MSFVYFHNTVSTYREQYFEMILYSKLSYRHVFFYLDVPLVNVLNSQYIHMYLAIVPGFIKGL